MTRSQRPVWLGVDRRGWDHARVHRQVLEDGRLGVYEVGVYLGLAIHAETMTGETRPAAQTLATYLACSERRVRDALAALAELSYIEVEERPGKASVYRLLPPPALPTPAGGSGVPRQEVPPTPAGGADEQEPVDENQGTRPTPFSSSDADASSEESPPKGSLPAVVASSPHLAAADALCEEFAAMLAERGERVAGKARSKKWRTDMEALLRIDGAARDRGPHTAEDVRRVLRWLNVGTDPVALFWRPNVRSPDKLRARWVQMAEQYEQHRRGAPSSRSAALHAPGRAPLEEAVAKMHGQGSSDGARTPVGSPVAALPPGDPA